jgi:ribosomal protein S18 acetylase RimI-like enzyme
MRGRVTNAFDLRHTRAGTAVMRRVLAEAASRGLPVTLQVLKANEGARRLYERLGFQVTGQVEHHLRMRHAGARP